ncbi:hypothetical protein CVT24_012665 [Panaeolus cyanescens]|uniref:Uncharacterized protein n=1 Tax=Panaeolus cyanescens TaxID=181874 RepID=A0A409X4H1_9AGAR|nr:hypothetical protein CVT24_012665 [Panaeolus cyanescens]
MPALPPWSQQHPHRSHWWCPHRRAHCPFGHSHGRCSAARQVQGHHRRIGQGPSPLLRQTGTLTTNKFTVNSATILTYGPFSAEDVILLCPRTENQDAIDSSVVTKLLAYRHHLPRGGFRGNTGIIVKLYIPNKAEDVENLKDGCGVTANFAMSPDYVHLGFYYP